MPSFYQRRGKHALLSAIQTKEVEDLAHLSFQTTPVCVDVDDGRTKVTNKGLQHGYCVVPSAKESVLLYFFLEEESVKEHDGFLLFM